MCEGEDFAFTPPDTPSIDISGKVVTAMCGAIVGLSRGLVRRGTLADLAAGMVDKCA